MQAVFLQTADHPKVLERDESEDQVVIRDRGLVRTESMTGHHHFTIQVNTLHLTHIKIDTWAEVPNRRNHVRNTNTARNHLSQHRLKDKVIFLIHQGNVDIWTAFQRLLQRHDRIDTAKSPAEDENFLALLSWHITTLYHNDSMLLGCTTVHPRSQRAPRTLINSVVPQEARQRSSAYRIATCKLLTAVWRRPSDRKSVV